MQSKWNRTIIIMVMVKVCSKWLHACKCRGGTVYMHPLLTSLYNYKWAMQAIDLQMEDSEQYLLTNLWQPLKFMQCLWCELQILISSCLDHYTLFPKCWSEEIVGCILQEKQDKVESCMVTGQHCYEIKMKISICKAMILNFKCSLQK